MSGTVDSVSTASLAQLDACKRRLVQTAGDVAPSDEEALYAERKWCELKEEEGLWLKRLGDESELDVEALVELCKRILKAAHKDLRGGYGVEAD